MPPAIKRHLPLAAAVAAILIATLVHAYYTERFTPRVTTTLTAFTQVLPEVPMTIGKWEASVQELDPEQFKLTNCPAAFQRMYRNRETGETVSVYLVVGSGRNITMHSPDWCYAAEGYQQEGSVAQYRIPVKGMASAPEFATAYFRHPESQSGPGARGVRILWTYSEDGNWQGPTVAKLRYTIRPALFKIYFIADVTEDRSTVQDTAIPKFVKTALPVINDVLFAKNNTT
jgi:hypothetical protein